eukprot:TRINITY_DN3680_c0_g1_i1.p1 TRINITY_DN3680_c0_g1~~TRINITY_DN3680_c0_g1_i1.p1  ORF type:complete len:1571 (-),score=229.03 TRINITY_DN3680_c0_g1_i1:12-4724(-)
MKEAVICCVYLLFPILILSQQISYLPLIDYYDIDSGRVTGTLFSYTYDEYDMDDLYVSVSNCSTGNEVATFQRCCQVGETENCFSTTNICVDDQQINELFIQGTQEDGEVVTYIDMKIENYNSCDSIFFSISELIGWHYYRVLIPSFYIGYLEGVRYEPFSYCCDTLMSTTEFRFDGIITIELHSALYTESNILPLVGIQLISPSKSNGNYLLPYKDYFNYNQISLSIDSHSLTSSVVNIGIYDDPLYTRFSKGVRNYRVNETNTFYFFVNSSSLFEDHLSEYELVIDISNIYTSDGTPITISLTDFHLYNRSCDNLRFEEKVEELDTSLKIINENELSSTTELYWRWASGVAPTLSFDWLFCQQSVLNLLSQKNEPVQTNTSRCVYPFLSEEYRADPCCNSSLSQCCTEKSVGMSLNKYQIDENRIGQMCNIDSIECIENSLNRFIPTVKPHPSYGESIVNDNCQNNFDTYQEFINNSPSLYTQCRNLVIPIPCTDDANCQSLFGIDSWCDWRELSSYSTAVSWERECKVPCSNDTECYHGKCIETAGYNYCYSPLISEMDYNINSDYINGILIQCIADKIKELEQYLQVSFLQELNLTITSTTEEIMISLYDVLLVDGCNPFTATSQNPKSFDYCNTTKSCNWMPCDNRDNEYCHGNDISSGVGDIELYGCNNGSFRTDIGGSDVCGKMNSFSSEYFADISQNGNCLLQLQNNFEGSLHICNEMGGYTDDLTLLCWTGPFNNQSSCIPDHLCPFRQPVDTIRRYDGFRQEPELSSGIFCPKTCVSPLWNTEDSCVNGIDGSWVYNQYTDEYACHIAISAYFISDTDNDKYLCETTLAGEYWPGSVFYPKQYTEENCTSRCRYDPLVYTTETLCNEGYHCTNPFCYESPSGCTEQSCTESGFCSAGYGCYLPFRSDGTCITEHWTPEGCLDYLISPYLCEDSGGFYRSYEEWKNLSKTDCLELSKSCHIQENGIGRENDQEKPSRIVFKTEEDCATCNGNIESDYNWVPGKWVQNYNDWITLDLFKRKMIPAYNYGEIISQNLFDEIYTKAKIRREADILNNVLRCSVSEQRNSLSQLSCLCFSDLGAECLTDITNGVSLGSEKACSSLPVNTTYPQFGSFRVGEQFILENRGCLIIELKLYPLSYFSERDTISLVRIPTTQDNRDKYTTVLNSNNIITGHIIGDGVFITIDQDLDTIYDLKLCFDIKDFDNETYSGIIIGEGTEDFDNPVTILSSFDPVLWIPDNEICVPITSSSFSSKILFPVGLLRNSSLETSYIDTIKAGEAIVLVCAGLIYLTSTSFSVFSFVRFLLTFMKTESKSPFWTTATISLLFLFLLGFNRFLYIIFVTSDALYQQNVIAIAFSELPAIFFFSIISLTVFRWAEFSHFKMEDKNKVKKSGTGIIKLTPYLIILNIALYVAVVLFAILSALDTERVIVTCLTTDDELSALTTQEIIAIIYIIFFSLVSLALLVGLIIYGVKILIRLSKFSASKFKTNHTFLTRSIMVVSSIFLVLQIILLLSRSVRDWKWTIASSIIFMLLSDVPGLIYFHYIFKLPGFGFKRKGTTTTQ